MPPLSASTTDQPSQALPFADTLGPNRAPPLSATSDMPVIDLTKPNEIEAQEAAEAELVDGKEKPANTDDTSGEQPEGEADGKPNKTAGEEGDKTSPQQRAAFARERNRRQAAEAATAELKARIDQLTEAVQKLVPKDEPAEDPRPVREKFDDPDAYDKALEGWATRRATEVATKALKADQTKAEQERQVLAQRDAYAERKSAFEGDHPDFDDVVMSDDLKISPAMTQAILEAEDGPAIAYHLGNNPDVADRLFKLSPAQAVYEIGKISAKLANPPRPKQEPIRPLAARNSAGPKSPDDMSMEEYAAYRKSKVN